MKLQFLLAFAVLITAAPAFAESGPHMNRAHVHTQTDHDRSPHIHNRDPQPHRQA
ncbi:MAG: hypothetical protein ABI197_05100 [Granulicella sp.]